MGLTALCYGFLILITNLSGVKSSWWKSSLTTEDVTTSTCSADIVDAYRKVVLGESAKDRNWCQQTMKKYGTVIGKKFGKMDKMTRDLWTNSKCDEQIVFKKVLTCDERLGWYFFNNWMKQRYNTPSSPNDGIECVTSHKANSFCKLSNVTLDFSKVRIGSDARSFANGFVTTHGHSNTKVIPSPGYRHSATLSSRAEDIKEMSQCDEWEERPAFVLSNDDPFNLSHYMNDVMMIWSMLVLAGRTGMSSIIIILFDISQVGSLSSLLWTVFEVAVLLVEMHIDLWFQAILTYMDHSQLTMRVGLEQ